MFHDINKYKIIYNKKIYIYLIICLTIGVLLMICGNSISDNRKTNYNEESLAKENVLNETSVDDVEIKLINILKKVEGVGDIDLMIYYATGSEKVPLVQENDDGNEILYSTEASVSKPYIAVELNPRIEGVVIVAQGGSDEYVAYALRNTVSTVLGIPLHKVSILNMK